MNQPDEKIHRALGKWGGGGPEQRNFCPCGAWGPTQWYVEVFNFPTWWFPTKILIWGLMEASLGGHGWLIRKLAIGD